MLEKEYIYVGAMEPAFSAHKFVTSIFLGHDGRYYTHEANGETISKFNPISLPRPLKQPSQAIIAKVGSGYIYTFQNGGEKLLSGPREAIEQQLVPLLKREKLEVHVRLVISSFLRFYQKTLELIEDYNTSSEDPQEEDKLSPEMAFLPAQLSSFPPPKNVMEQLINRFKLFHSLNSLIRLQDIAYLKKESAYFIHYQLNITHIANSQTLENDVHHQTVSDLISLAVGRDGDMINILYEHNDVYEFIIRSHYLVLDQQKIELPLTTGVGPATGPKEDSVLETVIRLDKQLYNKNEPSPAISAQERSALQSSMRMIIERLTTSHGKH